jgi:hypothetical protein
MPRNRHPKIPQEYLVFGQVCSDGSALKDGIHLVVAPGTSSRVSRMPILLDREVLDPGDCLIDQETSDGDLIGNPLTVSPYHAQWLLRDIFRLPKHVWQKVSVRGDEESARRNSWHDSRSPVASSEVNGDGPLN